MWKRLKNILLCQHTNQHPNKYGKEQDKSSSSSCVYEQVPLCEEDDEPHSTEQQEQKDIVFKPQQKLDNQSSFQVNTIIQYVATVENIKLNYNSSDKCIWPSSQNKKCNKKIDKDFGPICSCHWMIVSKKFNSLP